MSDKIVADNGVLKPFSSSPVLPCVVPVNAARDAYGGEHFGPETALANHSTMPPQKIATPAYDRRMAEVRRKYRWNIVKSWWVRGTAWCRFTWRRLFCRR
jgi:hypothetical protein